MLVPNTPGSQDSTVMNTEWSHDSWLSAVLATGNFSCKSVLMLVPNRLGSQHSLLYSLEGSLKFLQGSWRSPVDSPTGSQVSRCIRHQGDVLGTRESFYEFLKACNSLYRDNLSENWLWITLHITMWLEIMFENTNLRNLKLTPRWWLHLGSWLQYKNSMNIQSNQIKIFLGVSIGARSFRMKKTDRDEKSCDTAFK